MNCKQRDANSGIPKEWRENMKKILLTLVATLAGLLSADAVLAGPSVGVVIGVPPIVIGAPVYSPAPVYYAPAPVAYAAPQPYYAPVPVYAPGYVVPPVVVGPAPRYYAPVVVSPRYYGGYGYYGNHRGYGHGYYGR
jgi:hypothetical protein